MKSFFKNAKRCIVSVKRFNNNVSKIICSSYRLGQRGLCCYFVFFRHGSALMLLGGRLTLKTIWFSWLVSSFARFSGQPVQSVTTESNEHMASLIEPSCTACHLPFHLYPSTWKCWKAKTIVDCTIDKTCHIFDRALVTTWPIIIVMLLRDKLFST